MAKFLIADDNHAKRMMLQMLIEREDLGLDIVTAETTNAAKQLIDEHNDIVCAFIDYEMPTEFGPAVISHLRAKNPDALIALVTSADSEEYRQDAMDAGANNFLCTSVQDDVFRSAFGDLMIEWKAEL